MLFGDHLTALAGMIGTLAACYWRDANGGRGQFVDVALYEAVVGLLGPQIGDLDAPRPVDRRPTDPRRRGSGIRETLPTADGRWVTVTSYSGAQIARLLEAVGVDVAAGGPEPDLAQLVGTWVAQNDQASVLDAFHQARIGIAPVNDLGALMADPHAVDRGAVTEIVDPTFGPVRLPGPTPGWRSRRAGSAGSAATSAPTTTPSTPSGWAWIQPSSTSCDRPGSSERIEVFRRPTGRRTRSAPPTNQGATMTVDEDRAGGALAGMRVLELASGTAAAYCAKLLADLGADVVKVEPPEGDAARHAGPFPPDRASVETSGRFLYLGTGKQSVVVDPADRADSERLTGLLEEADVVIDDGPVPEVDRRLTDRADRVVWCSITPFGLTGPYAGYRAQHLNIAHAGGEGQVLPGGVGWTLHPERPPVQIGSDMAHFDAGANTAIAVLAAYHRCQLTGLGQRIDVSEMESQVGLFRTRLVRWTFDGVEVHQRPQPLHLGWRDVRVRRRLRPDPRAPRGLLAGPAGSRGRRVLPR